MKGELKVTYKDMRFNDNPILRKDIEAANTPATPKHTTRKATFSEAIDMGQRPHDALIKCEPSTTKEITKERLHACANAGFDVNDIAKAFGATVAATYYYLSKHRIELVTKTQKSKLEPATARVEKVTHQVVPPKKSDDVIPVPTEPVHIPDPVPAPEPVMVLDVAPDLQPTVPTVMRLAYIPAMHTTIPEVDLLRLQRIESAAMGIAGEIQLAVDQCPECQREQLVLATEFLSALKVKPC